MLRQNRNTQIFGSNWLHKRRRTTRVQEKKPPSEQRREKATNPTQIWRPGRTRTPWPHCSLGEMNGASKAFSAPGVRVRRQNFQTREHARRLRYATPAPLPLERVFICHPTTLKSLLKYRFYLVKQLTSQCLRTR